MMNLAISPSQPRGRKTKNKRKKHGLSVLQFKHVPGIDIYIYIYFKILLFLVINNTK